MSMKLFVHVLRSGIPAVDTDGPAATTATDSRRWVFRDLVVRRDGYAAWGLWRPASADGPECFLECSMPLSRRWIP